MCPYGRVGKLGDSRFLDRSYILWRSINLSKGSQNTIPRRAKRIVRYVNISIWFYMNTHVWLGPVCISATSSPQVFLFSKKVKYEIDAKKWTQKKIEDIFLLDNLFHFRISSEKTSGISCQVFQNLNFRVLELFIPAIKTGLLKSPPFPPGAAGWIHPSLPPRRVRCLPNLAAAELARPWDLGVASGGDIPIPRPPCAPWRFFGDGNNFPAGAQGLRLLFLAGFCSWEMWSCDPILFLCLLKKSWWGIFWQKHHGKG